MVQTQPTKPAPMDEAFTKFEQDPHFLEHRPTREQVARAWSFARFQKEDENEFPTHPEVITALKKLFPEFREHKSTLRRSH